MSANYHNRIQCGLIPDKQNLPVFSSVFDKVSVSSSFLISWLLARMFSASDESCFTPSVTSSVESGRTSSFSAFIMGIDEFSAAFIRLES